jgi:ABC-type transport system involved in multi-copper enzyme maturation permease subunit
MIGLPALLRHSLRRWRAFFAATAVLLVAFQFFMIMAARSLELSGRFRLLGAVMPAFMAQWSNMTAASFTGFVLFGYSHPLVQLFLVAGAIGIGSEPAAEIDTRFIDLVMARPVGRSIAINRTLILLVLAAVGAIACMLFATALGLRVMAPPTARLPTPRVVVSMAANLACLALAWGGITLVLSSAAKRRSTVAAICGLAAFAAFVLDYVGRFWDAVAPLAKISPFHYFDPFGMMGGRPLATADLVVLLAIFAVGAAVANVVYARRDL